MEKLPKVGLPILILIVLTIVFISKSTETIGSGKAGVLYKTFGGGVVTDQPPLGEGFHFVAPWNKVIVYEVRQQEVFEKMQVLSSNGLEIKLDASAWFQPEFSKLGSLHQQKGEDYVARVLLPTIRSAARSVVGRYTPEQLYSSKRDAIQKEIYQETKKIVGNQFIQLNEVLAKKEAERQKIDAEGKATANKILNESLTDKILREKGILATLELAKSPNAKVVVVGSGKDGMPLILGNQ